MTPAWNPNGTELFYVTWPDMPSGRFQMMAVAFQSGTPPRIGRPRPLFHSSVFELNIACGPMRCFDVAPDGQRFYGVKWLKLPEAPVVTHVSLIQNWFEELRAKVPTR
jgi:hypothetical protein